MWFWNLLGWMIGLWFIGWIGFWVLIGVAKMICAIAVAVGSVVADILTIFVCYPYVVTRRLIKRWTGYSLPAVKLQSDYPLSDNANR